MSLILNVNSIEKYYSTEPVLVDATFEIRTKQKLALIGPNGAGKSTLLSILMGQLDADNGTIELSKNARFGFLKQTPDFPDNCTVWEAARGAMSAIEKLVAENENLAQQIATATNDSERSELCRRFDHLQTQLENRGAFNIDHKIEKVLEGLGFDREQYPQKVNSLSGGQINRLMLARLLLEEPELMLLDEPSNHLDIEATEWLESFLNQTQQAFLLVSHDRFFLDRVVQQTLELVNGTIDVYPGNYSKYLVLKDERLKVQQRTFEKQQAEVEKLEDFVRRHHHGQKHAQAEDRRKKLEKIELVEVPREIKTPNMRFAKAVRTGDIVLRAKQLTKSFDEPLFQGVDFQIERGEKWGILGPNGCGKSTLLKCLAGLEKPDSGEFKLGSHVKIGYFDQKLKTVDETKSAAEAIRPDHREMLDLERRDLLAKFGVIGDMALQKISSMSGGERCRVALSYLAAQEANFLLLDEPTNHLDLWSRQALEKALKDFDGTILMVSHDRFLLDQVCDHMIVFEKDRQFVFEGNYSSYRQFIASTREEQGAYAKVIKKAEKKQRKEEKQRKRKRKYPYRKVEDIESEIAQRESAIEKLHFDLADPAILRDGDKVVAAQQELKDQSSALEQLMDHWQEALELN